MLAHLVRLTNIEKRAAEKVVALEPASYSPTTETKVKAAKIAV